MNAGSVESVTHLLLNGEALVNRRLCCLDTYQLEEPELPKLELGKITNFIISHEAFRHDTTSRVNLNFYEVIKTLGLAIAKDGRFNKLLFCSYQPMEFMLSYKVQSAFHYNYKDENTFETGFRWILQFFNTYKGEFEPIHNVYFIKRPHGLDEPDICVLKVKVDNIIPT